MMTHMASTIKAHKSANSRNFCQLQRMLDLHELQSESLEKIVKSNWQITVIFILNAEKEGLFFNEILSKSGLTPRTLSSVLKSLESEKMLTRAVIDSHPIRVKYSITDVGKKLAGTQCPIILLNK